MRPFCRKCFCFLSGCLLSAGELPAQPQKLYLNPATAGTAPQSKFVEITGFVPLGNADQKIGENVSLYITASYWVLYDYIDKKIVFLTRQGKFVKMINIKKYGDPVIVYDNKADVLKFNIKNKNYTLLEKDLIKIRAGYSKKANQKYYKNYEIDLKEKELRIKRTVTDPYFIINARWLYDDYYYRSDLSIHSKAADTTGFELQLLQNYKPVRSFFPFNKAGNPLFRYPAMGNNIQVHLSGTDTPYIKYTSRPFHTTIYKLNKDSLYPLYDIVLPMENAMPQRYAVNGFKSKSEWDNFQNSHGAVFFSINDIKDLESCLFFGIRYMRNYESFLYDKKNAKFYKTKMIKADSSQYNIQLLQNGPGQYEHSHYYTVIPARVLVDFYTKNKEKKIAYPPELEAYLQSATKDSNPVMVQYKIKD